MTRWRSIVNTAETARSASWDGASAAATVVVATCNRSSWLAELVDCLEQQHGPVLEVVVVDDSSDDATPAVLTDLAGRTSLPLLALRTLARSGPSAARNAGAAHGRSPRLLLTDDDCLPTPGWAAALTAALDDGAAVAQGPTLPIESDRGPWYRTITITAPTVLYETCNLGLAAGAFRAIGGFADLRLLPGPSARGFGEDAQLGSRLAHAGGRGWAPDALVRHRWVAGTFHDHLAGRRRLAGFPGLSRHVPELRAALVGGVALSRRTMTTDVGILAVAVAVLTGRLPALLAAVPWAGRLLAEARERPGRPLLVRAAQLSAADVVGAAALVRGSARARRLVL